MKKQIELENEIRRETQIFDFSQFIDVLEAIKGLKTKEEVDKNIDLRIEFLKKDIERMENLK